MAGKLDLLLINLLPEDVSQNTIGSTVLHGENKLWLYTNLTSTIMGLQKQYNLI